MNGRRDRLKGEGAVVHVSRRRLAAALTLVGILFIILDAGCSSSTGPTPQVIYVAHLLKDRKSLDRGVLAYSRIGSLKTAATTEFKVTVTDVGKGPQRVQLTVFNGMNVYQQDVPTRGIVGVQIVRCINLTCISESDLRQPVLSKGQQAEWLWSITAGTPGPALITLRADTYDQGSTQSLFEEIIQINVRVIPTPTYIHQQTHKKIAAAAKSMVGYIETIGSVAGAILAVGGIVGWIVMMRRKRGADARKRGASTQPEQPHRAKPDGQQQPEHTDKTP